jgi:MFS family permease
MKRNVVLLAACQAFFNTFTGMILAISALVGYMLAPPDLKWMATAPHALQWLSAAAFAIPVAAMMRRLGRKIAFSVSALLGIVGALVAVVAIVQHSFWTFALATIIFGGYNAAGQSYRFAAAEISSVSFRSKAISLVVGGGVVAAFLGPEISILTWQSWEGSEYAGTFLVLAFVPLLLIATVSLVKFPRIENQVFDHPARPLKEIMRQPGFIVAVLCATIGWGVMVLLMAATPIAMKSEFGLHEVDAMFVVQWHMVGMFAPSFVTGWLISRFGLLNILLCGLMLLAAAATTGAFGGTLHYFWWANVLVGTGWNFLFVGGTTLLTHTYRPVERNRVQGVNDFLVFFSVANFSFAAGFLQAEIGWNNVSLVMLPFVGVVLAAVLWLKFTPGAAPSTVKDGRAALAAAVGE